MRTKKYFFLLLKEKNCFKDDCQDPVIQSFKDEHLQKAISEVINIKAINALTFLHEVSQGVVSIVDFQNLGSTSMTLDILKFCFNEKFANLSSISINLSYALDASEQDEMPLNLSLKILYPNAWNILNRIIEFVGETSECQQFFDEFELVSWYYTRFSPAYITPINMTELMEEKFPHARSNYSSNKRHQECLTLETEVLTQIDGYVEKFKHVQEILMNLTTSEIQESIVLVETLLSYYGEIINIGLIYHNYWSKLNEACSWIKSVVRNQNSVLWIWEKTHDNPSRLLWDVVVTSLNKIRNAYSSLQRYYVTVSHSDIAILQRYLSGHLTKMELGKKLKSMEESGDVLYHLKEDLLTLITEYSTKMTLAKDSLVQLYEVYLNFDFPIINGQNVYELELVERAAAINDSGMQEIVDNLESDVVQYLPELITQSYNGLIESMEQVTYGLIKPIEDVLGQLDELRNDLEIYQTSTRMDTDFFM